MKKYIPILLTTLLLISCGTNPSDSTSEGFSSIPATSDSSSFPNSSSTLPDSSPTINSSSNGNSSTLDTPIPCTIGEILQKGSMLKNEEIGEKVIFHATYLRAVALSRSNEDLMYFADAHDYIYMRVPYSEFQGYLANRYVNQEYEVIGYVTKLNDVVELTYEKVTNLSSPTSCNLKEVSEQKNSLQEVYDDFAKIPLNTKYYGSGKIVTFDGQLIATEYTESNKKAVFYDGTNTISVVHSSKITEKTDIGKHFTITGILNIEVSSPAVLLLDIEQKSSQNDTIVINDEAVEKVETDYFSKWNTTSKYMNPPSVYDYGKLYQTTGYIRDDTSRTNAYYVGIVKTSTSSLSDSGITKSIGGLYLMNHQNMSETSFSYSPFYSYYGEDIPVTIYFSLFSFDTNNHAWRIFAIESHVPSLEAFL